MEAIVKEILCGADNISQYVNFFKNSKIGLITNPTGIRNDYMLTSEWVCKNLNLVAMYAPEHGVYGDAQDGKTIDGHIDIVTGVPVYSIYTRKNRTPSQESLQNIDMMIYDIQDVGARYYTYIYTMVNCMRAAAQKGIPFVVLDRPNLVGGTQILGTKLEKKNSSFIGMFDIPQQYALTCGELAKYFNETQNINVDLTVIPMSNWTRADFGISLNIPKIPPSPNLPSFDSILLYSGTCMIEGVNVSEGRGTTKPFEFVGAPFINARQFAQKLNNIKLEGVIFRPVHFTPMYGKHKNTMCNGVQIHIKDYRIVKPLFIGTSLILTLKEMYAKELKFVAPNNEDGDFTMDLLWGTDTIRTSLYTVDDAFNIIEQYSQIATPIISKYFVYE